MKNQVIESLQNKTQGILLSLINHNRIDTSDMTEDATWFVGSALIYLNIKEMQNYLNQNVVERAIDIPEVVFGRTDTMGSECLSIIGEVHYHSIPSAMTRMNVSFQANWVIFDGEWKLKQFLTSSKHLVEAKYTDARIGAKALIKTIPVSLICCSCDEMMAVQLVNENTLQLLGYDSITDFRNYAGNSIISSIHPSDMSEFLHFAESIRNGENPDSVNVRIRKKDFHYIHVEAYGAIAEGKWLIFACQDRTSHRNEIANIQQEKAEAEEEEEELNEDFRTILENMPSGFHSCALFEPVHVDYVSDSLCDMTGYTRNDIHDKMKSIYIEMVVPEDHHIIIESVKSLMQYPHTEQIIYRMKRKDGSVIRVLDKMRSVRDAEGRMWGYSIVVNLEENPRHEQISEVRSAKLAKLPRTSKGHTVEINTFGYFEVLVDGKPIAFRSAKA